MTCRRFPAGRAVGEDDHCDHDDGLVKHRNRLVVLPHPPQRRPTYFLSLGKLLLRLGDTLDVYFQLGRSLFGWGFATTPGIICKNDNPIHDFRAYILLEHTVLWR